MPVEIPSALVGQLVLFAVFAIVVFALVREAAKIVVKVMLVVGIALAVAILAGWLDDTVAGDLLGRIGDGLIVGIKAVVNWIMRAWGALTDAP